MAIIFGVVTVIAVMCVSKSNEHAAKEKAERDKISKGIPYADTLAAAIGSFLPGIVNNTVATIWNIGQKSVVRAEATYKAAISTATNLIKSGLALECVQKTAEIDKLIDAITPILVLAFA